MGGRHTHEAAAAVHDKVLALNRTGVELAGQKKEHEALACYLQACELEPTAPLQFQNAGHACVTLQRWQAAVFFHQRVRELDLGYDARPKDQKCECLVYARKKIADLQATWSRTWRMEDAAAHVTAGTRGVVHMLDGAEWNVDHCHATQPNVDGHFRASFRRNDVELPVPFFEQWNDRESCVNAAQALIRELDWKRSSDAIIAKETLSHPVLRQDVLQHVMSFLPCEDLRSAAVVCRAFYATSLRNALWCRVWLTWSHKKPLTDAERAVLVTDSFGHDGFLRNLLLRNAPLQLTQQQQQEPQK